MRWLTHAYAMSDAMTDMTYTETQLIGTTLTNKALLVLNNFETLGDQITVTDAQIPPL